MKNILWKKEETWSILLNDNQRVQARRRKILMQNQEVLRVSLPSSEPSTACLEKGKSRKVNSILNWKQTKSWTG